MAYESSSSASPADPSAPAGSATPVVELEGVRLTLNGPAGPVNILRGINFRADSGETVAIAGPSGSGKTSMMMVVAGLEQATEGRINVLGRDFTALGEDALALVRREGVGIVFQGFHLVPTMSALENVAVPLELARRPDAFARAREALAQVGLDHRLTHFPGQLSGGEQQRVALARAFAIRPKLLLADEPTGNLDGVTGGKIIDLMFNLCAETGTTLVLITHDRALAARCGRLAEMADGVLSETRL
ncbi:MAG: ABC transporter ATP-binding protein [Rhodospirillales bacterium]